MLDRRRAAHARVESATSPTAAAATDRPGQREHRADHEADQAAAQRVVASRATIAAERHVRLLAGAAGNAHFGRLARAVVWIDARASLTANGQTAASSLTLRDTFAACCRGQCRCWDTCSCRLQLVGWLVSWLRGCTTAPPAAHSRDPVRLSARGSPTPHKCAVGARARQALDAQLATQRQIGQRRSQKQSEQHHPLAQPFRAGLWKRKARPRRRDAWPTLSARDVSIVAQQQTITRLSVTMLLVSVSDATQRIAAGLA